MARLAGSSRKFLWPDIPERVLCLKMCVGIRGVVVKSVSIMRRHQPSWLLLVLGTCWPRGAEQGDPLSLSLLFWCWMWQPASHLRHHFPREAFPLGWWLICETSALSLIVPLPRVDSPRWLISSKNDCIATRRYCHVKRDGCHVRDRKLPLII